MEIKEVPPSLKKLSKEQKKELLTIVNKYSKKVKSTNDLMAVFFNALTKLGKNKVKKGYWIMRNNQAIFKKA